MDFMELKRQVESAGLLERRYGYYAFKIFSSFALLSCLIVLLFYFSSFWLQLIIAAGLAFSFVQVGLLGHDAAHLAIFKKKKWNDLAGLIFFGFVTGVGFNHWVWRHNAHHANPNTEDEDPDVASVAQTVEEVEKKAGFRRFVYERQHFFFPFIMALSVTAYQIYGISYNIRMKKSSLKWADSAMMLLHFAVFWVAPFFLLPWWKAISLVTTWRILMGLYFGAISATNHKGMRVIRKGEKLGFLEKQILTTRNVRMGRIVDFVYGGLNYQVEHHLFSDMPRVNFAKCKRIVMKFCSEQKIPYFETGVVRSYIDIVTSIRRVSIAARKKRLESKKQLFAVKGPARA